MKLIIIFFLSSVLFSANNEINLYLKWKHGFQFAGYYAAQKKGYYQKEGLKVKILENISLSKNRFSEILKDEYAYGTETQRILIDKENREKIRILSVIFQHSPLITVTLKKSGIKTPQQFTNKKFLGHGLSLEIKAMLKKEGVDLNKIKFIKRKSYDFNQLINNEADIMPGYITTLPYKLKKQNIEFNVINPISYGVDFYGDFIFTTLKEIKEHPQRVKKFLRASIKGWEYAMSHKDEMIKYILKKYPDRSLSYDMLKYEADTMEKDVMLSHFIEIGHINIGRWKHIEKILKELNLVSKDFNITKYIYTPKRSKSLLQYRYFRYLIYAFLIISILTLLLFLFNLKLNKEVKKRIRFAMESEEKFKAIFNNNFQYAAILDMNGKILLINKTAMSITKYEEDKLIGKYFWDTPWFKNSENSRKKLKNAIHKIKDHSFQRFEITNKLYNGKLIYIDVSLKAVKNLQGEFDYIIVEGRDITDLKNMEKIVGNSQKMEAIGLLAGGIAHDFNNIISAIIVNAELIKMDSNGKFSDELEQIIKAGKRAKKLVNRIITFSKGVEEEKRNINLITLLDGIIKLVKPTIDTDKIKITVNYKNNAPVYGVYTQIEQVVMNIIRNAVQAIEDKGEINISLDKVKINEDLVLFDSVLTPDTYLKLTVKDTGCGIAKENLNRIFEPYYSTKNKKDGTGLGLFVTHGIIEKHNAFIDVKSILGKGTSFEIYFPIVSYQFDEIKTNTYGYNESNIIIGEKQKILFVDDEEMIARNMYKILTKKGFSVNFFTDPAEALEEFRKSSQSYDIVITDQNMPEMTGVELVSELRKIRKDIAVILCSGYNSVVDKSNIDKYGINEFLEKPITISQLISAINQILK